MHKWHNDRGSTISVFGCGNMLVGGDPAGIAGFQSGHDFADILFIEDTGTGLWEYLVDFLLAPNLAPKFLIVLDAVDSKESLSGGGGTMTSGTIPAEKIHNFSLNQLRTFNLLLEIAEQPGASVHLTAAQVAHISGERASGMTLYHKESGLSEDLQHLCFSLSHCWSGRIGSS